MINQDDCSFQWGNLFRRMKWSCAYHAVVSSTLTTEIHGLIVIDTLIDDAIGEH